MKASELIRRALIYAEWWHEENVRRSKHSRHPVDVQAVKESWEMIHELREYRKLRWPDSA